MSESTLRGNRLACAVADHLPRSEFGSKDLQTVGNYQLERLIGQGSFGKVFLATHKLTNGSKVCTRR